MQGAPRDGVDAPGDIVVGERQEIVEQVMRQGTCQNIKDIPQSVRDVFVVSGDITAEEHVRMQAALQAFVDNSLSKTVNFPETATEEDVAKAYMLAWELGCKGITVYVTGSREKVVLETKATVEKKEAPASSAAALSAKPELSPTFSADPKKPRPRALTGKTYKVETPVGKAFVTINENGGEQPFEAFINTAKAGSETAAVSEAIGRLISYILRMSSPTKQTDRLRDLSAKDLKHLIHELGTHQIELEMQNEELRRTQLELQTARDRYAELYNFAPAGHFTLDRKGVIQEANLRASILLGIPRGEMDDVRGRAGQLIWHGLIRSAGVTSTGDPAYAAFPYADPVGMGFDLYNMPYRRLDGSIGYWPPKEAGNVGGIGYINMNVVRQNNTFGVIKLTLHPTSYDWKFVPEAGKTFTDSGTRNCFTPSSPNQPVPTNTVVPTLATKTPVGTSIPVGTATPTSSGSMNSPSMEEL